MKQQVIKELCSIGAVVVSPKPTYVLKSGRTSNLYIDMRKTFSEALLVDKIAELCYQKIAKSILKMKKFPEGKLHIIGVPSAGIAWAKDIAGKMERSFLFLRKAKKEYGMGKLIEGDYKNGDSVVLIEDVTTTGGSTLETINILKENGLNVVYVLCLVDRGGVRNLAQHTVVDSIFELRDFLSKKYLLKEMCQVKQSNIIFSADIDNCKDLLETLDEVGPYICAVKTHVDLIKDYSPHLNQRLKDLARKHFFLVIEDQKYADIGRILKQKYLNNIYRISDWADFVTIHLIAGEGTLEALSQCNACVIPVIEMSSKDNLIDKDYTQKCIKMCEKYSDNVAGFVTQCNNTRKETDHGDYMYFTPGVNLTEKCDGSDQTYRSPQSIELKNTDFFIIGRGIYGRENKTDAMSTTEKCKEYQKLCWKSK